MRVALGVVVMAALGMGLWSYQQGQARPAHPSHREYPVRGVDVSHHNGVIRWQRVKQANIHFAYIKASEGGNLVDSSFAANARGAARAGIPAGAYHYFTLCRTGAEQARNFLAATAVAHLRLAPAIDLEFSGNCDERPSHKAFNRELAVFVRAVRKRTGREPILYVTPSFHAAYIEGGPFRRRALWYRDLRGKLSKPPFSRVAFWQFTARARVNGIQGPVDLNAFVGSQAAFRRTLGP
jgi:lysozyme